MRNPSWPQVGLVAGSDPMHCSRAQRVGDIEGLMEAPVIQTATVAWCGGELGGMQEVVGVNAAGQGRPLTRLMHVDAVRGVAILLMTVDHAYDWWLTEADRVTFAWQVVRFLGSLAAPIFLYLVGVGMALSIARATARGEGRRSSSARMLLRGATLVVGGYVLNLALYFIGGNFADILAVDILHTIGVGIWLSVPLLWAPQPLLLVLVVAVGCAGQTAGRWALADGLAAYVTGNGGIGYFPLAVWLPFVWAGLVAGRWVYRPEAIGWRMAGLAGIGLGLFALTGVVDASLGYRHPRPVFVLFSMAIILWLTAGSWLWSERWGYHGPVARTLSVMGRSSLMLYVLHHLIGYRAFWLLGWASGRSWRGEYGTLTFVPASVLLAALVGVMVLSSHWWCRVRLQPVSVARRVMRLGR